MSVRFITPTSLNIKTNDWNQLKIKLTGEIFAFSYSYVKVS